jgi:tRNA 2-thiouridine synthesizing protein A
VEFGGGALARVVRLDNRGLDPPEPMIRTLRALAGLGPEDVLEIHNDRRPVFLYPKLAEGGFRFETRDQPDGSAVVRIWRDPGPDPPPSR